MAKSRKSRKLNLTEKYERRRLWAGYFGLAFKEMKRATSKALKAIEKAIKEKRLELKQEGVTDIPTVAQVNKYERERKQQERQEEQEEREPLPYADEDDSEYFDETEDIINQFISVMNQAMEATAKIYGLTQPWLARIIEEAIANVMAKFQEARALKGDKFIAQFIANNLDYDRIVTLIAYDYNEAVSYLSDMADAFAGIIDSM